MLKNIIRHFSFNRNVTGGEIIYKKLLEHNVKNAFIFSGGSVMPIVDPFYKGPINYFVNTHEQNCGHAATGYAKSSNRVGVCLVTSGPGITNMITPMLDATNDSTPLLVISGQVPKVAVGTNAFQEAPAVEISKNVTKWSYQIQNIEEISEVFDKAFYIANDGKKGAVHIDVPKCVSNMEMPINYYKTIDIKNNYNFSKKYDEKLLKVSNLIFNSRKPIIYLGQGCHASFKHLRCFAIENDIPVTSTIHGKGIFDDHHELSLEWCGMHGHAAANYALQEADCIIALGSRFDDRTTGLISKYAPVAREKKAIIHVNIEKSEFNKALETHHNFEMDCGSFLKLIRFYMEKIRLNSDFDPYIEKNKKDWITYIKSLKNKYDFQYKNYENGDEAYHMEEVLHQLYLKTLNKDVIFTTGVGNHQMQAYQFIKAQYPKKILSSGSLGVMGAGLPYAIGAQIANREKLVIDIDGDSSFNMTLSDLKTIKEHNLPIKIAVMNNHSQMMVTIWEKLYFKERYTATLNKRNPDYCLLAESFGIKSIKCDISDNLEDKIDEFINYDGPILCDFDILKDICLPLVGPGKALDDMLLPEDTSFDNIVVEAGMAPS